MADTVSTVLAWNGAQRGEYVSRFTNRSDGTGESAVVKIDASTLANAAGVAPSKIQIDRIEYAVSGFAHVLLQWDRTSDVTIAVLPVGSGIMDFSWFGGFNDPGTGDTGDVLLTTNGAVAGAAYDLTIYYKAV
jgi:hypothetical protein